jgi:hypothetical protein
LQSGSLKSLSIDPERITKIQRNASKTSRTSKVIDPTVDLKVLEQQPEKREVKIPGQGLEEWLNKVLA